MSAVEKYFAVDSKMFPEISDAVPFDVFLKLGTNKYTKVFSRGLELEMDRLTNYQEKGINQFYILKQDRRSFLAQSQKVLGSLYRNGRLNSPEALQVLTDIAAHTLTEIFTSYKFDYTCFELSTTVVSGYLAASKRHPEVLPELLKLAKAKTYVYQHSITTSVFSCLLARQMDPANRSFHLNAGIAGFLHDIGLCKISMDIDEHGLGLSGEATRQLEAHPVVGAQMVAAVRDIPMEVRNAILEHHENMNGTGYPQKISGERISKLGRLVAVTEEFAALVSGSKENFPLTPQLAMHAMRATDRLDPEIVAALGRLLKL